MVILIFAAEELIFEQRMGHDIRVSYDKHGSVSENSGAGKVFPGGPCCAFRGKLISALVTCSKKVSITSDILKSAFERLNESNIYERTATLKLFALFDAQMIILYHQQYTSRLPSYFLIFSLSFFLSRLRMR